MVSPHSPVTAVAPDPGRAPRILLAHDLSGPADLAAGVIAQGAWPPSTIVRVASSPIGIGPPLSSFANLREIRAHGRLVRDMIERAHDRLASELGQAGLEVGSVTLHGKPERVLIAEAERFGADLIVVGARGQGSMAATLLGSVSRAVAERAATSVLVVRTSSMGRLLLGTDGSAPARFATRLVATWPIFARSQVLLVAVGKPPPRYARAVLGDTEWRAAIRDTLTSSFDQACDVVQQTLDDLGAPERDVEIDVRLGDVETELTGAAEAWPGDLVVLGTAPRPRLQRLFLGSDVRKVLDGVTASVLIARPPADAGSS